MQVYTLRVSELKVILDEGEGRYGQGYCDCKSQDRELKVIQAAAALGDGQACSW